MSVKGYQYSDLKKEELERISSLEKELNNMENRDSELILLAFNRDDE